MDLAAGSDQDLRRVWNQKAVPVLLRRGKGHPLRVRLPFASDNRAKLRRDRRTNPAWIATGRFWEVPQAWFNQLVAENLATFGRVYIIQPYNRHEVCAPACWNAKGHECQCSCMGFRHGEANSGGGWMIVSDTFAVQWKGTELACRLITRGEGEAS